MKFSFLTIFFLIGLLSYSQTEEQLSEYNYFLSKGSAYLYTQKDSANFYLNKCYDIADESKYLEGKLYALTFLVQTNGFHYDLNTLKHNLDKFEKNLNDPLIDSLPDKLIYKRRYHLEKGQYFFKIENHSKAKKEIDFLIKDIEQVSNDNLLPEELYELYAANSFLAAIYSKLNKNNLAKQYYTKNVTISRKYNQLDWGNRMVGTKMRLAGVFENEKNYKESNRLLIEVLPFYISKKDNPRFKNNLLSTYQRLSKNYLLQDSISKAIRTLKESETYYSENDAFIRSADLLYGDIYTKDKQFEKAENFYQSYLAKTKEYRQNQKHQDISEAYTKLGKLYLSKENPEKSLEFYQESLMQLAPSFDSKEIKNNPDPKKVLSKLALVKVLKEKLEALHLLYKKNGQLQDLKIAFATAQDIIKTLDLLKPEFESKVDKQFLISQMYPAFHSMVTIAYDLYETTKESKYIDDAFYFTEKSKSILLLEAARSTQATSYGGIPEQIIDQEQQFRANIIHLEKKYFNQKSNMVIFDSLFKLKNRYYNFISDIEQDYPKYYDLKYNAEVISLEETAAEIVNGKALLSYFSTNTDLFLIVLENDTKSFYKIPWSTKDKASITKFYTLVSKLNNKDISNIHKEGTILYEKLLKNALNEIKSKELIIISDDILNYIPFEALSTSENPGDYLIKEYQISYANSATMLKELKAKEKAKKNQLLAFAPAFDQNTSKVSADRSNFGPLLHNTTEVANIMNYFPGKSITGSEASLQSFSENSQAYNMIHFATHAAANDENPDYSYLAFTSTDTTKNNLLYVKDLYGYTLTTDLVTLSACQTGLGKLQKGEGMLSLAKGFSYAGAKSLVTTLWKINDQTTSELMQEFYKNLDDSMPKDMALREAKLAYLKNADDDLLTHPYFWSGFMISGDVAPLQSNNSNLWWLFLLVIPVLILVVRKIKS